MNAPLSDLAALPQLDGGFLAVAHLAHHHGVLASAAQLNHESGLGDEPPTAEDLARAAVRLGLKARIIRDPGLKRMKTIPVPAIIKVKDGTWAVFGVETSPGRYRVVDPVTRRQEHLTLDEVTERLDHDVILIGKGVELAAEQLKFGLAWFWPAIRRYRKVA